MGTTWISSRGAMLGKLAEHGRLWVADRLPPNTPRRLDVWKVVAEKGDRIPQLITKWIENAVPGGVPHAHSRRERVYHDIIRHSDEPLALVVEDAHLLKGHVIDKLRLMAEEGALVVLVGDPSRIDVAAQSHPGFYQRASYCVQTVELFSGESQNT